MKSFNKNVTSQMKAIALMMMLAHHLWREPELGMFEPIAYGNILISIGLTYY